jgi:hypothetical protein
MKTLSIFTRFLAGLCAFLFVLATSLVILLFYAERLLLDPEVYKEALQKAHLQERLPGMIARWLAAPPAGSSFQKNYPTFLKNLTSQDWEVIVNQVMPGEDMQAMAQDLVNELLAYLKGESSSITIPLSMLKERLASADGMETLVRQVINKQPACSLEEVFRILSGLVQGDILLCNPQEDAVITYMMPLLQGSMKAAIQLIPDEMDIPLIAPGSFSCCISSPTGGTLPSLSTIRLIFHYSPVVPLILLLLITMLAVRSIKGWLLWWGLPLLLAGLLTLILTVLIPPALGWLWDSCIMPGLTTFLSIDLAGMGRELLVDLGKALSLRTAITGGILLLIGLVASIAGALLRRGKVAQATR